jgi:hypothetical protein
MAKKKEKKIKVVKEEEKIAFSGVAATPEPRVLSAIEFEVRDLSWAAAVNCICGHQLDLFTWNIPEERVCPKCGRKYSVRLVGYEEF